MDHLLTMGNLTRAPQLRQSSSPVLASLYGPVLVPLRRKLSIPNLSMRRNLRWVHIVEVGAILNHRTPSSKAQITNVGTTSNHPADHADEEDPSSLSSSENDFSSADVKQVVPELHHELRLGEFVDKYRKHYRQKFPIRVYEAGADKEVSISTIFRFFQEVVLCQIILEGIAGDMFGGIGATRATNHLVLIWAVAKTHVEVEQFPKCTWCMMHSTTRRLCKRPAEVEEELGQG
uniref:Acyl-[acyl-carrier-protein] hydrolase n=1 Tax=Physcomitrium patens TaxID=3218 RepID=A0A2K1K6C9_PHYPA|nr:hypothetical protein PHYPA_011231 [Physcomitrium patens]